MPDVIDIQDKIFYRKLKEIRDNVKKSIIAYRLGPPGGEKFSLVSQLTLSLNENLSPINFISKDFCAKSWIYSIYFFNFIHLKRNVALSHPQSLHSINAYDLNYLMDGIPRRLGKFPNILKSIAIIESNHFRGSYFTILV